MRRGTPEGAVLRAVCDLLTAERVWWMRCQTGAMVLGEGTVNRRFYRSGRPGMADLLALPREEYCPGCGERPARLWPGSASKSACCCRTLDMAIVPLWIECKSATGRQSPAQKAFEAQVEAEGHNYLLIRDVRTVQEFLRGKRFRGKGVHE